MKNNDMSAPATKADLNKLAKTTKVEMTEMKADITEIKTKLTGLNEKIDSVRTELKSDINRLEGIVKTNTIDILHIKNDIRDIRDTMSTKDDINRVMTAIDAFAAEALSYRNQDALRGRAVMDHEKRLVRLENPA